jgi:hypothetical protein
MERGKRDQRRGERVSEPISEKSIFRPGSLQSPHLCDASKKSKSSVSAALRVILKPPRARAGRFMGKRHTMLS